MSSTPGAPTPTLTPVFVASPSLRSSSSKLAQLTLEQILEHLDNLRLNLTNTKQNCASALAEAPPTGAGWGGQEETPLGAFMKLQAPDCSSSFSP